MNDAGVVIGYRSASTAPPAAAPSDQRRISPALIVQRLLDHADGAPSAVELARDSGWTTSATIVVAQFGSTDVAELNWTGAGATISRVVRSAAGDALVQR